MLRKQMRHTPNLRKKARGRPQSGQRLYALVGNLGFLCALAIIDFFAKVRSSSSSRKVASPDSPLSWEGARDG